MYLHVYKAPTSHLISELISFKWINSIIYGRMRQETMHALDRQWRSLFLWGSVIAALVSVTIVVMIAAMLRLDLISLDDPIVLNKRAITFVQPSPINLTLTYYSNALLSNSQLDPHVILIKLNQLAWKFAYFQCDTNLVQIIGPFCNQIDRLKP